MTNGDAGADSADDELLFPHHSARHLLSEVLNRRSALRRCGIHGTESSERLAAFPVRLESVNKLIF